MRPQHPPAPARSTSTPPSFDTDVVVVGAGLAGCSAAIQMARRGHAVVLIDKQRYPVDKLCGEFLSPEVQGSFRRLGVLDAVERHSPHRMHRMRLTAPGVRCVEGDLTGTALGLRRWILDPLLAEAAAEAGAEVRLGTSVRAVEGSLDDGFTVTLSGGEQVQARFVFGAHGKRSRVDQALERRFLGATTPYVAFKAHYAGVRVPHTIELHSFPGGYCGLSHVEDGTVNVCWIGRVDELQAGGGRPEGMIDAALRQNPYLAERFDAMERVSERFCAVSQVSFARKPALDGDVCMVGDSAGMIAPLCGDGMAMALRSAELAVPFADDFLQGRLAADGVRTRYPKAWAREFRRRFWLGRMLHACACEPRIAAAAVRAVRYLPALGTWLIRNTRGTTAGALGA